MTRHVFRHEMKGTSLFLLKVLEIEGILRKYVRKDFYRYLDRQHRVFPFNTRSFRKYRTINRKESFVKILSEKSFCSPRNQKREL